MRGVETSLDEIFAFWLGDEGLELCGGESINETCLRDDEQQDLGTSQGGEFISLFHNACFPFGERYMTSRFVLNKFDLDLSSSGLLVGFGLLLIFIVVACAVCSIVIVDERVVADGGRAS
jgi:hypothetical protein